MLPSPHGAVAACAFITRSHSQIAGTLCKTKGAGLMEGQPVGLGSGVPIWALRLQVNGLPDFAGQIWTLLNCRESSYA